MRAHLEEDAAKTIHVGGHGGRIGGAAHSNVDFNRGGTPLVEIVTQPDLHSAEEAVRFLRLLRQTIVETGISDAEMEKGTLRVDANVSVRRPGSDELRTRTEIKNMNSFTHIGRGIEAEVARQVEVWEGGGEVVQQTYDFHVDSGTLTARRSKEEAEDYRYFPEPDLVPVEPPAELVERMRAELPELPGARIRRLEAELDFALAEGLVTSGRDALYEATPGDRRAVANVVMNQLAGAGVDPAAVDPAELGEARRGARADPAQGVRRGDRACRRPRLLGRPVPRRRRRVSDAAELEPLVDRILAANPGQVEQYRGGKQGLLGFFVGQVMKETGGSADAKVVSELVAREARLANDPRAGYSAAAALRQQTVPSS